MTNESLQTPSRLGPGSATLNLNNWDSDAAGGARAQSASAGRGKNPFGDSAGVLGGSSHDDWRNSRNSLIKSDRWNTSDSTWSTRDGSFQNFEN